MAWYVLQAVWSPLSQLDKSVFAALVTGTLIAVGAISVKHVEHRHSVEAQFRSDKVELFNSFVETLNQLSGEDGIGAEDLAESLKEWKRRLLFWGSPKTLRIFLSLGELGARIDTVEGMAKSLKIVGALLLAMRKDIGVSNKGVTRHVSGVDRSTVFAARYILRDSEMFLHHLRKNPTMSMEDFTRIERQIDSIR